MPGRFPADVGCRYTRRDHGCDRIGPLPGGQATAGGRAQRLSVNDREQVVDQLKHSFHDGTTHVVLDPMDSIARLAALVPRPRAHLTRYHGVFAPNFKHRRLIIPNPAHQAAREPHAFGGDRVRAPPQARRSRRRRCAAGVMGARVTNGGNPDDSYLPRSSLPVAITNPTDQDGWTSEGGAGLSSPQNAWSSAIFSG